MDITNYIPNVFGTATPSTYEGLLGMGLITPEQMAQTQKTANIQGLLGAGLALAQGMSKIGPRRSAAENVLGALAGGFGAAGGAYQQGLQNIVQQQQLQSAALTQQQTANRLKAIQQAKLTYPDLAPLADIDPGKFAEEVALRERIKGVSTPEKPTTPEAFQALAEKYYAAGPNFKALGDAYMEQAKQLRFQKLSNITGKESASELRNLANTAAAYGNKPLADQLNDLASRRELEPPTAPITQEVSPQVQQVPTDGTIKTITTEPVVADRGRIGQTQLKIDNINSEINRLSGIRTQGARETIDNLSKIRDGLQKDLDRLSVMEYDFANLKKEFPAKYSSEIAQIENQAQKGTLDSTGLRSSIEKLYTRLQEDEKGRKLSGNSSLFAKMKFGTDDSAKLTGPQFAEILRFENAPTADQLAQLNRESLRLRSETGLQAPIPAGRESMLFAPRTQTQAAQTTTQPTAQTTTQPVTQPTTAPVRVDTNVQPQVATQPSANVTERQPIVESPYFKVEKNPLINKREIDLPIKRRQELLEKQSGFIAANQYSMKNIIDARNSAKALLDNPAYIDALTSRTAKLYAEAPAGIVLDQTTYTANEILKNIQGRSFINEIQEMRANSPTGGAVGNVAVAEMQTLSNIGAALQLGMNKAEFIKQLQSYVDRSDRSLKTIPNQYSKVYGYNGEFDDIFASEVVKPTPTQNKPPRGVTVRKVP